MRLSRAGARLCSSVLVRVLGADSPSPGGRVCDRRGGQGVRSGRPPPTR